MPRTGAVHHIELWVPDLARAEQSWGWLLGELGYEPFQSWERGRSWRCPADPSGGYVVVEQSPAMTDGTHVRTRPGLNHLAFWAGSRAEVDALAATAAEHGWSLMFADRHPFAGGAEHYAAYLEDGDGYEVELVAS